MFFVDLRMEYSSAMLLFLLDRFRFTFRFPITPPPSTFRRPWCCLLVSLQASSHAASPHRSIASPSACVLATPCIAATRAQSWARSNPWCARRACDRSGAAMASTASRLARRVHSRSSATNGSRCTYRIHCIRPCSSASCLALWLVYVQ